MRRPWQIWLVYSLCLAFVLPAMTWLTLKTIQADRAEWMGRMVAEREEVVGSVLWQMDSDLTTLLAQEAARPHFVYSSFYTAPAALLPADGNSGKKIATPAEGKTTVDWSAGQRVPSPLMTHPSPYVLLHFQITSKDVITSPQVPRERQLALDNGAKSEAITLGQERIDTLCGQMHYAQLDQMLTDERLSEIAIAQWQLNNYDLALQNDSPVVGNTLRNPRVQQEREAQGFNQAQAPLTPYQQAGAVNSSNLQANNGRMQQRGGNDLEERNRAYQSAAQRQVVEQRTNFNFGAPELKFVSEGISQPIWLGDRLLLARRVKIGDDNVIQGCWLDWPKIHNELLERYQSTLPDLDLKPVLHANDREEIKVSRLLATLPVQLVVPEFLPPPEPWSPIKSALVIAWSMLGLAAVAVACMLQGVITLSERRGAFVSAVTHELRTPLTTFRMYAEMLAENMVPTAETRQRYLETLRVEADRLSHLVENVLAYARLERGKHGRRRVETSVADLIDRTHQRFFDRAADAEMKLVIEEQTDDHTIQTDPAAVEQILFNLIDNACKYASQATDRRIHVSHELRGKFVVLSVADHGPGIDTKAARRLFQPFSKSVHDAACSAPGVGLGLALSRRLAQELGGRLELETISGGGAKFSIFLPR